MEGFIPAIVITFSLGYASFTDITGFKVYNALTIPLFFGALVYSVFTAGLSGLMIALTGAGIGFCILLIPYLMGGLGAGDVKFVTAIGAWIGPTYLLPGIIVGCVVTVLCFGLMAVHRTGFAGISDNVRLMFLRLSCFGKNLALEDQFESVRSIARSDNNEKRGRLIPFSAMVSLGILLVILGVELFKRQ